jgi:ATP-binding cassette, subfamily B, multidrug efflux pump
MDSLRSIVAMVRPYWGRALVALFFLTSLVLMDLAIPRLVQRIVDEGIRAGSSRIVLGTSLIMLAITAVSVVFAVGNNITSIQVAEAVARDLRERIFLKIQSFAYGDLDRFTTGKLMVRLTSDAGAVQRLVQISLRIGTRAPLLMIGSLLLMFNTDRRLALTMLPLLFVTTGVIAFFSVKMEPLFRSVQQRMDRLSTVLQENIAGVRLVKAFARAGHEEERFGSANAGYADRVIQVTRYTSIMGPVLTIFVNIGIVVVVWAGGLEAIRGEMTEGQIVAFTNYLLTTMNPLIMMTMLSSVWANGIASMRRVAEVLDVTPEVQDAPDAVALPPDTPGRVAFENVSFHYRDGAESGEAPPEEVLRDVSLVAAPGATLAILGATGSGKSSLVHLIPRFYDVTRGRVTVDGIDVRAVTQGSLLALVSIVAQETVLFSGTVRANIRYGRPEASDAEVVAAARAAQAHDFILGLEHGYDTHVEERGVNLSGGQKQRIAIARALIMRPRILILDDSTSAVDVETETRIHAAMDAWLADSTVVLVAQRISTVLNADQIVVLEKGRVAARGRHHDLLRTSPIYREIYDSQLGGGPEVEAARAPVALQPGGRA